jgi:hypothetical protein
MSATPETMTRDEVLERYGNLPLTFSSYYKYSFHFSATAPDGAIVGVSIGGCADDIYRCEINAGDTMTLRSGEYSFAHVSIGGKTAWSESNGW